MTTYTAITAAQTDADSYIDTALIDSLKNNVLAIAEQDASAVTAGVQVKGTWIQLAQTVISATPTEVDFENFIDDTNYDVYIVELNGVLPTTDDRDLRMRVGTGGTPTYQTGTSYLNSTLDHMLIMAGLGNASDESLSGFVHLFNPSDAAARTKIHKYISGIQAAGTISNDVSPEDYNSATAVTAIRFFWETAGTFAAGTFTLYGLMK